jgi:hypothetical protein
MGANERSYTQIQAFHDTVDIYELMDIGYTGVPWTFEKKVAGGSYCRVRLDWALATASWCERYPLASLRHLLFSFGTLQMGKGRGIRKYFAMKRCGSHVRILVQ